MGRIGRIEESSELSYWWHRVEQEQGSVDPGCRRNRRRCGGAAVGTSKRAWCEKCRDQRQGSCLDRKLEGCLMAARRIFGDRARAHSGRLGEWWSAGWRDRAGAG